MVPPDYCDADVDDDVGVFAHLSVVCHQLVIEELDVFVFSHLASGLGISEAVNFDGGIREILARCLNSISVSHSAVMLKVVVKAFDVLIFSYQGDDVVVLCVFLKLPHIDCVLDHVTVLQDQHHHYHHCPLLLITLETLSVKLMEYLGTGGPPSSEGSIAGRQRRG